ncbi:hypothetical protein [Massilia niabensis]|uniref:hypothetical protein n=1 Tax=Massilia niabensis TaxID=544910 RepID=UPI0036D2B21A
MLQLKIVAGLIVLIACVNNIRSRVLACRAHPAAFIPAANAITLDGAGGQTPGQLHGDVQRIGGCRGVGDWP